MNLDAFIKSVKITNVVVPAEQNQQCRCGRGHEDQPFLGKGVGIEKPLALSLIANRVDLGLGRAIEHGEVEVRRGVVFGDITRVRTEKRVGNQRRECERQRRVPARVKFELRY